VCLSACLLGGGGGERRACCSASLFNPHLLNCLKQSDFGVCVSVCMYACVLGEGGGGQVRGV